MYSTKNKGSPLLHPWLILLSQSSSCCTDNWYCSFFE